MRVRRAVRAFGRSEVVEEIVRTTQNFPHDGLCVLPSPVDVVGIVMSSTTGCVVLCSDEQL